MFRLQLRHIISSIFCKIHFVQKNNFFPIFVFPNLPQITHASDYILLLNNLCFFLHFVLLENAKYFRLKRTRSHAKWVPSVLRHSHYFYWDIYQNQANKIMKYWNQVLWFAIWRFTTKCVTSGVKWTKVQKRNINTRHYYKFCNIITLNIWDCQNINFNKINLNWFKTRACEFKYQIFF